MRLSLWAMGVIGASFITIIDVSLASTACDAVNSGSFNRTNYTPPGSGVLNTMAGFEIGETISFMVSGLTGSSFELINGALNTALLTQPLSSTPASVSYTITGSNSDTTLNTYMLVQAIPYEISITATCSPVVTPVKPSEGAKVSEAIARELTKAFLMSRINSLLLNQPNSTSLRERSSARTNNTSLFALGFADASVGSNRVWNSHDIDQHRALFETGQLTALRDNSLGLLGQGRPIHFRQVLSETIRNLSQARDVTELGGGATKDYEASARFDAWGEAYYTDFNYDQIGILRDGHSFVGYIGADYRFSDSLLIGALIEFDSTKESSGALVSQVDGNGWMSGPYLSARLYKNIYLDLRAAAGTAPSNDLEFLGVTANFVTARWLFIGRLSGDWLDGPWQFTPMTDVAYIEEKQGGFSNSNGAMVPSQLALLGRATFGPEISYSRRVGEALIKPFGSIKGIWNFDRSNIPLINGQLISVDPFWGRVGAGVDMLMPTGTTFRIALVYDGLGVNDYRSFTAQGQLSVPLN